MSAHLSCRVRRLLDLSLSAAYVPFAALYVLYITFKFGNLQTEGLFPAIGALIAVNVTYIGLLFNRARATDVSRIKRRTLAAAEIAMRGFVALILSTFAMTLIYVFATTVFAFQPALHPLGSLLAPTYPVLTMITFVFTFGVLLSIWCTLSSIKVLIRRDFGRVSADSLRRK